MDIIPSLLVQSEQEFRESLAAVLVAVDMVQIDIADGEFVPNTTWSDPEIARELLTKDAELHLMANHPVEVAGQWQDIERITRVLFHFEAADNPTQTISALREMSGWQVGMVLNPDTPTAAAEPFVDQLDSLMFMGVKPGFQGQSYISETTSRIAAIKSKYPNLYTELDGGVNEKTLPEIMQSGVDAICPGSAVFHAKPGPAESVQKLKDLIAMLAREQESTA